MEMSSIVETQTQTQTLVQLLQDQSCCFNELNLPGLNTGYGPSLNGLLTRPMKTDPGVENGWVDIDSVGQVINSFETRGRDLTGRESLIKRRSEKSIGPKGNAEEDRRSKRSKRCEEEEESKVTEQNSNGNGNKNDKKNKETSASGCTSNVDYIHVRARRGQATDSHSLAERVRREKISERMKYLQDLVPGCNKITGKAGMLDEIINYVQSLQRQVEFLSMKLAAVNPSIDALIAKEVLAACSTSMPTMGVNPDMSNPNYVQYNPIQQMELNPIDMGLRRTISAPVSVPETETSINPSCFNLPSSLPWDAELQNIYAMEFQQARSTSFPLQTFQGTIEASSLRMEM